MSSLSNPSRLLLRNSSELAVPRLLLAMPPADAIFSELQALLPETTLQVFTTIAEVSDLAVRSLSADQVLYSHDPAQQTGSFDAVVLYLQKSRPLVTAMVDQLCAQLTEGGILFLVGENGVGIKSWKKRLQSWGDAESLASGCHSGMVALNPAEKFRTAKPEFEQKSFSVEIAGTAVEVTTLPGVFSHGRLDGGTKLFMETLSLENIRGKALDFGCGAGVIGTWLTKRHHRCRSTLLHTDAMALEAARQTLKANDISDGKVVASHGLKQLTGKYDWIVSNPPFHEGVKTHYDVTEAFLQSCKEHMVRGGQLRIVANNFLRYKPLIEEAFGHCEELAKGHGFIVYGATLADRFQSAKI